MALDGTLMAAGVAMGPASFESSVPQSLFPTSVALIANVNRRQYAASRDGNRFLINAPDRSQTVSSITVLLNWRAAIRH